MHTAYNPVSWRPPPRTLALLVFAVCISPSADALPSFARQTGQNCAACHVSSSWPQLTPWGRFFKLSGYTAGKQLIDKEGLNYVPVGVLGQIGATWATQPNNSLGQPVVTQNGSPEAYAFTGEIATKLTDYLGVFYEYQVGNQFPGWKGTAGPVDIRAVHFFHPGGNELLVGIDTNNNPTVQDVWNSTPSWGYPFYGSPQAPGGPASPMISSLGEQSGSVGVYALLNREWYVEVSVPRGDRFFPVDECGDRIPGRRRELPGGLQSLLAGVLDKGTRAAFIDGGHFRHAIESVSEQRGSERTHRCFHRLRIRFAVSVFRRNSQADAARELHLRKSAVECGFPVAASSTLNGNLKSLNVNGSYGYRDHWIFNAAYFSNNGTNNTALYAITAPSGTQLTSSPNTSGYVLEADRLITQNLQATLQYKGFVRFNGLTYNIDGLGRNASANNTLWLTIFFAF